MLNFLLIEVSVKRTKWWVYIGLTQCTGKGKAWIVISFFRQKHWGSDMSSDVPRFATLRPWCSPSDFKSSALSSPLCFGNLTGQQSDKISQSARKNLTYKCTFLLTSNKTQAEKASCKSQIVLHKHLIWDKTFFAGVVNHLPSSLLLRIPSDRATTSCFVSGLQLSQDHLVFFTELSCRNTIGDVDKLNCCEAKVHGLPVSLWGSQNGCHI